MSELQRIEHALSTHRPKTGRTGGSGHASVALILRQAEEGVEVLFIRRAEHPGDPWSGDVAFPGGRVETADESHRAAAERETREEIGLDLTAEKYLGQLDDIEGAYLPVTVSCFGYLLESTPELQLNHEVIDSFWLPLTVLRDPQRNRQASFSYRGTSRTHPIVDLDGYCERFLWGITYRLLQQFLTVVGNNSA